MDERELALTTETAIALHGELASCGITFVVLRYEGQGDSGNECYVALYTDAPPGTQGDKLPFEYSNGPDAVMDRDLVSVGTTDTTYSYASGKYSALTAVKWSDAFHPDKQPTNPVIDHQRLAELAGKLFDGMWGLALVNHNPDFNNDGSYGEMWWDLKRPHIMGTEHNVRISDVSTSSCENPLNIPGPAEVVEANLEGAA